MTDAATAEPLPLEVQVTEAFTKRLPPQRLIDQLARLEMNVPFQELAQSQPFRIIAFRRLLQLFPDRDVMSLWMHAYDVEVDVVKSDGFLVNGQMPTLPSVPSGTASPTT